METCQLLLIQIDAMVEGQTALHVACQHGHCDIIRELIDRGADKDKLVSNYTLLIHSEVLHVCL